MPRPGCLVWPAGKARPATWSSAQVRPSAEAQRGEPLALPRLLGGAPLGGGARACGDGKQCSGQAFARLRAAAWCVVGVRRIAAATQERSRSVDSLSAEMIGLDLARTDEGDDLAPEHRGWTRAMLLRYAADDPAVGYCQGLTFVASAYASASVDQHQAYHRLRSFLGQMRGLWLPGFPLLEEATARFEVAVKQRGWFQHLGAHEIDTSMYLPQGFLTLFGLWLPRSTVVRCLSFLELHGLLGFVAIAVAVLDSAEHRLLRLHSMEELLFALRGIPRFAPGPDELLPAARRALIAAGRARASSLDRLPRPQGPPWNEDWSQRSWRDWVAWAVFM
eukprot:CAMPEP_0198546892 /NCGR_PEP_ID=MMETSP1462-20131121/67258_1 /TAXON_ID=1333877 /ORGANISM="Brandtodinium nutriculum, Strain RCC3387" /LENGTH=333 /DNA_ID=CAMNT_0044277355 /DNA_START=72 /DNA_END=1073 /DNA_ORIENTATION=+